ncbi:MAG: hypothetical protein KME47_08035 [Nodosilinea sp. WJT8-NPBG4]|jgi:hypothetical protein|nr:hypothetical protein [Nodosilinea sp. WJT8-NPBG4]
MSLYFATAGEAAAGSSLVLVYVVGFIAAVTIGSVAWYNSKRPAGWENKEKPDFVPTVNTEEGEEV